MRGYVGQLEITRHSRLNHLRLHSSRPPPSRELRPFAGRDETEASCTAKELCRRKYRDHADIHVGSAEVVGLWVVQVRLVVVLSLESELLLGL